MQSTILIVGGAGFIGFHCSRRALLEGRRVVIVDNLSRAGARANLAALKNLAEEKKFPLVFVHADVRNAHEIAAIIGKERPEVIVHQAAQVAVTTSVENPRLDFEINALGTFNVLEAVRIHSPESYFIFASTNKVYGGMEEVAVVEEAKRYRYRDLPAGVDESHGLDLHSPYGCSKGAADQYVRDYHRIYGLRTVVFRQSCIYGTHQYGIEDQGWIAWFVIASVLRRPITVYGTGKQVRDVLWVDDLCEAYWRAWEKNVVGQIYNMGGGAENTLSLLELLGVLKSQGFDDLTPKFSGIRPGDQPVYVANAQRARRELDWIPSVAPRQGVHRLIDWVRANRELVSSTLGF